MLNKIRFSLRGLWVVSALGLMLLLLTSCEERLLRVTSSISPEPIVGRVVTYHVELAATAGITVPNTTLTITLPSGVELIKGDLRWHGDLAKNQTVTEDLIIRVTTPGEWIVAAFVDTDMGYGRKNQYHTFTQALYITSSADSAEVVDALQKTPTTCSPDVSCGRRPIPVTSTSITAQP
jgi:hypothetical protein